jgi:hypothetical protein
MQTDKIVSRATIKQSNWNLEVPKFEGCVVVVFLAFVFPAKLTTDGLQHYSRQTKDLNAQLSTTNSFQPILVLSEKTNPESICSPSSLGNTSLWSIATVYSPRILKTFGMFTALRNPCSVVNICVQWKMLCPSGKWCCVQCGPQWWFSYVWDAESKSVWSWSVYSFQL